MDEKYKRLFKLIFSMILTGLLTLVYAYVWIVHFNGQMLQAPFFRRGNWMMIALYMSLLIFFMQMYGGYKVGYFKRGNLIYSQVLAALFTNTFTYFQIAVLDKRFYPPLMLFIVFVIDIVVILSWTLIFENVYSSIYPPRQMLLVSGECSDYHLAEKMNRREDKYVIKAKIDYQLGMREVIKKVYQFDGVIIGDMPSHERNQILKYCYINDIRTYCVPKISDVLLKNSVEMNLFDSPLILSRNSGLTIEQEFGKRMLDIMGSLIAIAVTIPFFMIVGLCIKLSDGGPVLYRQTRLTKDGKRFQIYKLRTMAENAESNGIPRLASENDPRIIPYIGTFLRRTRLDELPQIYNILKGDMSIVGPRPERPELAEEISEVIPEFSCRLKVKAGLTGYAQVYGKYNTTAYDKLKLDLTYIGKYSILLDLQLILMTPKIMLLKESTEGAAHKE